MRQTDYAIVGAGPAGVQLAFELKKRGIEHIVFEKEAEAGAFFKVFPRHRKLISINKVYTGYPAGSEINERWDWNSLLGDETSPRFGDLSDEYFPDADLMVRHVNDFVEAHGLAIEFNCPVEMIDRAREGGFVLKTPNGEVKARRVVVATGRFLPNTPKFEGVELCEDYTTFDTDPDRFKNKRVVIVGKGNSAFETADSITPRAAVIHVVSPKTVQFAWRTHYVGHLRAVNNNFLDTFQLKSQNGLLDAEITRIERTGEGKLAVHMVHTHAEGQTRTVIADHVILATGFRLDRSIFAPGCQPELTECQRLPVLRPDWMSVNVPDLYFAGTLMHQLDYQKSFSGFIHGFRYNIRALARMLDETQHGVSWPTEPVTCDAAMVTEKILDRLDRTGGLFQQPGFLCDVYEIDRAKGTVTLRPQTQMIYERERSTAEREYLTVTLEFGKGPHVDPFDIKHATRHPFSRGGEYSTLIHPVVRRFVGDKLAGEHHVHQTLDNCWTEERFRKPLETFIGRVLAGDETSVPVLAEAR